MHAKRRDVTDFLQLLISGTATGAIYALAALGFTLVWQASGTINYWRTIPGPACTSICEPGVNGGSAPPSARASSNERISIASSLIRLTLTVRSAI
jgi:hypothetical protein